MRVYVAGPYSAGNVLDMLRNIRRGTRVAVQLMQHGHAPFCPWLDHQYGLQADLTLKQYQEASTAWLRVAEAVVLVPGWENSIGTLEEVCEARRLKIPVYNSLDEFLLSQGLFKERGSSRVPGGL